MTSPLSLSIPIPTIDETDSLAETVQTLVRYGRIKLVLNYFFQRLCFCPLVSNSRLTDFTYGYRLYPSDVLKNSGWQESDHAFVLETILKPLLDHVSVKEVPTVWKQRKEGERRSRFRQKVPGSVRNPPDRLVPLLRRD